VSFAAWNFISIAASDLIPEVKHGRLLPNNLVQFAGGVVVILVTRVLSWAGPDL